MKHLLQNLLWNIPNVAHQNSDYLIMSSKPLTLITNLRRALGFQESIYYFKVRTSFPIYNYVSPCSNLLIVTNNHIAYNIAFRVCPCFLYVFYNLPL